MPGECKTHLSLKSYANAFQHTSLLCVYIRMHVYGYIYIFIHLHTHRAIAPALLLENFARRDFSDGKR